MKNISSILTYAAQRATRQKNVYVAPPQAECLNAPPTTPETLPPIPDGNTHEKRAKDQPPLLDNTTCHFNLRFRGRGTSIKIRWSTLALWCIIAEVEKDGVNGYKTALMKGIYRLVKGYPKEKDVRGLGGYIADMMLMECVEGLRGLIPDVDDKYERIMANIVEVCDGSDK